MIAPDIFIDGFPAKAVWGLKFLNFRSKIQSHGFPGKDGVFRKSTISVIN